MKLFCNTIVFIKYNCLILLNAPLLQALIRSPTMVNWCMCVIMTFSSSSTDDHSCFLLVPVLHPNRWVYMSPVEQSDWSLASGYTSSVHKVNWWGCCSCVFENLARKDHSIVNVNKNSCCRIPVPSPNSGLSTICSPLIRWWIILPIHTKSFLFLDHGVAVARWHPNLKISIL